MTTTFPYQLGEPVEHRGIVIAPLFPRHDPVARYVTLDEALPRGLTITEKGESGSVPELVVQNPLDNRVLLYDGEELVGAKQNRILNVTVLVEAGKTIPIPVSCVEEGRWRWASGDFGSAKHISPNRLRRVKAEALAAQPLARGVAQGAVWQEVDATLNEMAVPSPTRANRDAFDAHRAGIEQLEGAFGAAPGQCGAVLALGDVMCLDLVSRPDAFSGLWPKLRTGYMLDALGRLDGRPTAASEVEAFVAQVVAADATRGPSAGLGEDRRLRGAGVIGSGLELGSELLQLSAYTSADGGQRAFGRIARPSRRR